MCLCYAKVLFHRIPSVMTLRANGHKISQLPITCTYRVELHIVLHVHNTKFYKASLLVHVTEDLQCSSHHVCICTCINDIPSSSLLLLQL